jgi:hypothetical protein
MVNCSLRRVTILLTVVSLSARIHAKVGSVEFSTLVREADVIVLGNVVDVTTLKGVKVARVKVLETYKGPKVDELFFLAQPTWVCDISEAVKGETALLLLHSYTDPRSGMEKMFLAPLPSRKELEGAAAGKPMFLIIDSGRGRMPLRTIKGQQYATLWVGDVRLPASVQTVRDPNQNYSFIPSVRLTDLVRLVGTSMASLSHLDTRR